MFPYLSAKQLFDWQRWLAKYHAVPDRLDIFFAQLNCMFYNVHRGDRERVKNIEDFMPYIDKYADITNEELAARLGIYR